MLYTQAPSTWPAGSNPTLRIAANSSDVSAEPQVPLRRISAIRASATEGRSLLTVPSLILGVPLLVALPYLLQRAGGLFPRRIGAEQVLAGTRRVGRLNGHVPGAEPPLLAGPFFVWICHAH